MDHALRGRRRRGSRGARRRRGDREEAVLPGALTAKEQGYDLVLYSNAGLVAPAGTPKEIVAILNDAVRKASATSEVKTKLDQLGGIGKYMDTAGFDGLWGNLETKLIPVVPKLLEQQ